MKNQWRVILGLVLVLIVVIFAVLNNQWTVNLNYFRFCNYWRTSWVTNLHNHHLEPT